jgi:hypothetical protein
MHIGIIPIMIHIGVTVHIIPIILVIIGDISIITIGVGVGMEITTGIIVNIATTITGTSAIGIVAEVTAEIETVIAHETVLTMITDIQKVQQIR